MFKLGVLKRALRGFVGVDRVRSMMVVLAVASVGAVLGTHGANASGSFLALGARAPEPSGATGLCDRYGWACADAQGRIQFSASMVSEISRINRRVNRAVRAVSDRRQYGVSDLWSYPASGAGDCEDYALAKKRELVAAGYPSALLMLATVHSTRTGPHAVLVLRTEQGDYVLDNLNDEIVPWRASGYSFLRIQSPTSPRVWHSGRPNRS
ncbi:transglutaminase-like cysteine peptidase [Roseibacterium sp. SDUM158017]|uniref:transglutaminase-like cysteine peptidase n=1 Tax=Roseicyclus salinarum TaxID=3036773 RepID=UPI002415696C|nr:transglutaminase-like cysteine peptidase [Roseibacterium sp. SDUM158017]MDG4648694.1 transglutaminase-like cysteine peptidase [Roseibacterium sp. SDUM158017]